MEKMLNDITEINCKDGKLYLSVTMDCFDGATVGMSMDKSKRAELCKQSLQTAIRRYEKIQGMIVIARLQITSGMLQSKGIPNLNPVITCAFHSDILAVRY